MSYKKYKRKSFKKNRSRTNKRTDKKYFSKTASRMKKKNSDTRIMRGGYRL